MILNEEGNNRIRRLDKDEPIPYNLLLLADESIEAVDKYIKDSDIYILEFKKEIVSVYVLQIISPDTIEIKNIAVEEKYQGQGIGKVLLNDAFNRAKESGFKTIIIGTGDASIKQLYLYQKIGFEIFDIRRRFFLENYPAPIYENGIQLKHMIMLKRELE